MLFLVDGKLALLQPSNNDLGERKYDMRILAQNVEYYVQLRDQSATDTSMDDDGPNSANPKSTGAHTLRDSLWMFDGNNICAWTDVQDIIRSNLIEGLHTLPTAIHIPVDFYPTSILLNKGILLGVEPELIQRRDITFAFFRLGTRVSHRMNRWLSQILISLQTQLFLPHIFQQYLSHHDSPAALHLAHHYQHLLYFPHVLEVLLHNVLDEEAEQAPAREHALLPSVLSFISSFPSYLDILVQCTRKTEVRSWRTLFAYLPPPQELFEESLQKGLLKTAGGYLLVLHTLEELGPSSDKLIRLLSQAKQQGDWELCKELARFLMSLDPSGETLREAAEMIELMTPRPGSRRRGFSLGAADEAGEEEGG